MKETKINQRWVLKELTSTIDTTKFLGKRIPTIRMLNRPVQFRNKNSGRFFSSRWDKYLPATLEATTIRRKLLMLNGFQGLGRPRSLENNKKST